VLLDHFISQARGIVVAACVCLKEVSLRGSLRAGSADVVQAQRLSRHILSSGATS